MFRGSLVKILLLTQFYHPEPELRNHQLARGLLERGHEVEVVTAYPNYPSGHIYPGYKMRAWSRDRDQGVPVLRLPIYANHSPSGVLRGLSYLSFFTSATLLGTVLSKRPDLVFVYHPPLSTGLAGLFYRWLKRVPFVLDIQDMWPESLSATGVVNNGAILKGVEAMAGFLYKRAAAVTVISPGFKRLLVGKGVPEEKVRVIHNWVDDALFRPVEPDLALASETGMAGRFNVLYAGNMGPAQDLGNVLGAAALLQDLPELQFVFVGDGVDRDGLVRRAKELSLKNVRFLPRVPVEQIQGLNALAGAVLVHLADRPLFDVTIPGKTQSSLASGRPIVASVVGDAAGLVRRAGAGLVAKPGDPDNLAARVRELYVMKPEQREAMGAAGREFFLKNLSRDVLLDRFEALFDAIVHNN
jgi:glycosyltransferase involved in cell wall biosynthesis